MSSLTLKGKASEHAPVASGNSNTPISASNNSSGKLMARGSKSLKIMELLEAHTSSHHESTGQENDASAQEKQSRHRGKTVMANVWTSTEKFIIKEAAHDLQVSYTSSSANFEQNEINEMVFQKIYGAEHNGRVRGLGLGPTPSRYFSVTSKFTSTSASTTDNNHKAELENVKLELAEMKDKYEKLSSDFAEMKELFGGFMAERSFNDRMSKAPGEEVEDVASVE